MTLIPERSRPLRAARARAGRACSRAGDPAPGVRVFYGHDRVPAPGEPVAGGTAKFQRLATRFPNHPTDFSLLYLGSTWLPRDLGPLLWLARRRGVPLVVNQDGVGYPGWAGARPTRSTGRSAACSRPADHVLYQSEFCKRSADEWVGEPRGTWEILHNAVDVEHFTPAEHPPEGGPVLLLGGDQYAGLPARARRFGRSPRCVADASRRAAPRHGPARQPRSSRSSTSSASRGRVHVARALLAARRAGDLPARAPPPPHEGERPVPERSCVEAMASGLPVVYPRSGGVPELVGDDAGIGVPHPDGFERDEPPAAGGARRRRLARPRRSAALRGGRARRARSSASRSSRGSTVTRSSSSGSPRGSRGRGRGASRAGTAPRAPSSRTSDDERASERPDEHPRDDARAGSGASGAGSRRSRRRGTPRRASSARTSCRTTSDGSYSIRAPRRTARMR